MHIPLSYYHHHNTLSDVPIGWLYIGDYNHDITMQSVVSSLSRTGKLFSKSSNRRTFSKRREPAPPANGKKKQLKKAAGSACTPHEPFGLSKQQITQLKRSIETSHQSFFKDWTRNVLTSTNPQVMEVRKDLRQDFAKVGRNMSMKRIGLWGTAKNVLTGNALYARTEEDGVREHTDELGGRGVLNRRSAEP